MVNKLPFRKTHEKPLLERVALLIFSVLFLIFAIIYLEIKTPETLADFHLVLD